MDERTAADSLGWVVVQKPKKRRCWQRRRLSPVWRQLHGLDRPAGPSAHDAAAPLIGIGGVHAGMKASGELPDSTISNGLHPREPLVVDGELKIVDP